MIGRHDNRGALRLRNIVTPEPTEQRRNISPAITVAIVVHAVLVVGLVAWKLPLLVGAPRYEAVSATVNFAGLREPDTGGAPNAGGHGGGSRSVALAPSPIRPKLNLPPLPIIAPRSMNPVTVMARTDVPAPGAVPLGASGRPSFDGDGDGTGTGDRPGAGNGTGTGVGNGAASGVAGNGNGLGAGRPDYLRSPQPRYPSQARQNGWEGTTILRVEVLADGVTGVVEIVQSSGYRSLDEAAIDAVRAARFQPARLEGVAIVSWVEVPITFRLNRG